MCGLCGLCGVLGAGDHGPDAVARLDARTEPVRQAAIADMLVMTKTDLADIATAQRLAARLRQISPTAPLLHGADDALDLDFLMSDADCSWVKVTAEFPAQGLESGAVRHALAVFNRLNGPPRRDQFDWKRITSAC